MTDAVLDPDPPDKPPAETYADPLVTVDTLTIADPCNPEAFVESDTGVSLEDAR